MGEGLYLLFPFTPFFFFINKHFNKKIANYVEIIVGFFHLYKLKEQLFPVGHNGFLTQVVTQWTSRAWAGCRQHVYCAINC